MNFEYFKSPKIARNSGVVYVVQKVFFKTKGCLSVIGVVFSKMICGYFKSPKITRNSGVDYVAQKVFFKIKGYLSVKGVVFSRMIYKYF